MARCNLFVALEVFLMTGGANWELTDKPSDAARNMFCCLR